MGLRNALVRVVGHRHVLDDPELRAPYERDWTGRFGGAARLVVRPADAGEVAAVVRACADAGAAVVPQGGNTGLVGASVPRNGEVVLSLTRLDDVGAVDDALGQVTVGAGTTLATLQDACRRAGHDAGLDFAARDSCTLGGVVACDAGGARALRHGTARARVVGVEAVLADGAVVSRLQGLTKDDAGYDLPALLVGSEGTLGVITAVRWRTTPLLRSRVAALVPVASVDAAAGLLAALRAEAPSLESCDFFLDDGLELVLGHQRRSSPVARRAPVYVLAECAARSDPTEELVAALERAGIDDALVADDTAEPRGALAPARGPQRGHQRRRRAAQARRRRPARAARALPRGGARRRRECGPRHPRDPLRPPRRRQRPRQPPRARPDDERADDAVLELVARARWHDQRRARRRGRQGALARARARRAGGRGHARDQARARPAGLLNPGAVLAEAHAVGACHERRLAPVIREPAPDRAP